MGFMEETRLIFRSLEGVASGFSLSCLPDTRIFYSRIMMDGEAMTMNGEMTTMEDIKDNVGNKMDDR
jgi:hypothetical protein